MILVDSSVWIDYFNGKVTDKTDWLDSAIGDKEIIVGDIILTEVLQGFQNVPFISIWRRFAALRMSAPSSDIATRRSV